MAQGRLIKKEVASDPELNRLSPESERLYLRTLPHLDRDGLITGRPPLLWATVAPLRVELLDRAGAYINEWVENNLVIRYDSKDGPVLFFKGFRKNNLNITYHKESASTFPPPPGWIRTPQGMVPDDEESCFQLAQEMHPSASYRKTLLSQVSRDLVATMSRLSRDEDQQQDQIQDQHVVVVDQTPHTRSWNGGGAGGGDGDPAEDREWALQAMGRLRWKDKAAYHDSLNDEQRTALYAWLSYWEDQDGWGKGRSTEGITNPVGYIRWNLSGAGRDDGPVFPEKESTGWSDFENVIMD